MTYYAFLLERNKNMDKLVRPCGTDCYTNIDGRLSRCNAEKKVRVWFEKQQQFKPWIKDFTVYKANSFRQALDTVDREYPFFN